ncbi:hypothetical protein VQ02_03645 [Methylobacterium variabile]|jgi:hypothetical protein|uniref:Uncharacterized protein n=1 Tax=Methylobacterium variabile TaxID=298794 RepID=A0A0J6T9G0_9HYPH|nr:hypothetical protein [Methylobacterium variabile]KMO42208.1 hypothetical protein VQ02_03645 [Methylobacterium variabile]
MIRAENARSGNASSERKLADGGPLAEGFHDMEVRLTRRLNTTRRDIIMATAGLLTLQAIANIAAITWFILIYTS